MPMSKTEARPPSWLEAALAATPVRQVPPPEIPSAVNEPVPGQLVVVRTMDLSRSSVVRTVVVLGVDEELGTAIVALCSPEFEMASELDVYLDPEISGAPFPLIIEP